jgi:hypothetical protein
MQPSFKRWRTGFLVMASILLAASLAACRTAPPAAAEIGPAAPLDLGRFQTVTEGGVTVQLAVPTDEDVQARFGVSLAQYGIQPIWMRVENASASNFWLLPIAIDPDYFTADEAALVAADDLDDDAAARVGDNLRMSALPFFMRAGSANEGYVYATHLRGGRFVDVRFSTPGTGLRMRFAVMLPTQGFDYESSALRQLYGQVKSFPDLTLDETRQRLREMPCCTSREGGTGEGDPINIVLVGRGEDVIPALTAGGWTFTEAITVDSIRKMIGAAISDEPFFNAPVSALYLFGRPQDIALQRARAKIAQRNHMRLWLAPFRCEGQPVWVGQVSRDIGVKVTAKAPTLTTHVIDPNVDESRQYVLQSLLHQEAVRWFALVRGVGPAPRIQPRHNLTDDPFFTDGNRMVIAVSSVPIQPWRVVNLEWNESTDPIREGKGEDARVLRAQ